MLGLFPRTRWPAVDSSHEEAVRRSLTAALVQGVTPEPRTAALVSLLSAIDRAHKVVDRDGLPAGQVRKRAKEIAKGEWAAKAVKDAIAASTAAITAAVVASTAATTPPGADPSLPGQRVRSRRSRRTPKWRSVAASSYIDVSAIV